MFQDTGDFTRQEVKLVVKQGIDLVRRGYITAVNLIASDRELPSNAILIHYLQDSRKHIDFITKELEKRDFSDFQEVPRSTAYIVLPEYARKPNFLEEYRNAHFMSIDLEPRTIEEVANDPTNTIVVALEYDLIIPVSTGNAAETAEILRRIDQQGPEQWLDPAIIISAVT